jgi:hypothetical protein
MTIGEQRIDFDTLVGETLSEIRIDESKEYIVFVTDNGEVFKMFHPQFCCEIVQLEDVVGDIEDIIGSPILMAEEVSNNGEGRTDRNFKEGDAERIKVGYWPKGVDKPTDRAPDSYTWTFYKLGTIKGTVTLRWYGTSNGCYSESVDFVKCEEAKN